jgi:hypothetical protein
MNDDDFNRRLADFDRMITTYIAPYTVMLAIADKSNPTPQGIIGNGTGSLINTGTGQFLVTNNHVYEAFEQRKADSDDIVLMMTGKSGMAFADISDVHLRSRDSDRDLAVLDIPVATVQRQGKLFSMWDSWPPPRPEVGMAAVRFGYPGQGRVPMGDTLGIRPLTLGGHVSTVTEQHFSLVNKLSDSERRTPEGATPLTSYAGISGSAVYVKTPADTLILAGFVYRGINMGLDTIFVTFASHINADGALRG